MRGKRLLFISTLLLILSSCRDKYDCIAQDNIHDEIVDYYETDARYNSPQGYVKWKVLYTQTDLDSFKQSIYTLKKQYDFNQNSIILFETTACPEAFVVDLERDDNAKTYTYHYEFQSCNCWAGSEGMIRHSYAVAVVNKLDSSYQFRFIQTY